jgi:hypothetical protein
LSKPGLLIIFGGVFALVFWLFLDASKSTIKTAEAPAPADAPAGASRTPDATTRPSSAATDLHNEIKTPSKPLNLQLDSLNTPLGIESPNRQTIPPQHEGPLQPEAASQPASSVAPHLLPDRSKPSENGVIYGYEGKEEESHKVTIGIHQNDVTVKTQIKAGEKDSEVQGIEIEVKLPK